MGPHNDRSACRRGMALFALLSLITVCAAHAEGSHASRDQKPPAEKPHITITRYGYGKARPDGANLDFQFAVQGDNLEAVEKKRDLLLASVRKELASYVPETWAVAIYSAQSGQLYQEGKNLTTYSGTIRITVSDLSHWKEVLDTLEKQHMRPSALSYYTTDTSTLKRAWEQAQKDAILLARQDAERLTGIAGARIVNVLEIHEGKCTTLEPYVKAFENLDNAVPSEIPVAYAEMTLTFEIAPPVLTKPVLKPKPTKSKSLEQH